MSQTNIILIEKKIHFINQPHREILKRCLRNRLATSFMDPFPSLSMLEMSHFHGLSLRSVPKSPSPLANNGATAEMIEGC